MASGLARYDGALGIARVLWAWPGANANVGTGMDSQWPGCGEQIKEITQTSFWLRQRNVVLPTGFMNSRPSPGN